MKKHDWVRLLFKGPLYEVLLTWIAIACIIFIIAVSLAPMFIYGLDGAIKIWRDWQSLITGVFALFASVIALSITIIREEKQRVRSFTAARAELPLALSELVQYHKECSKTLANAYQHNKGATIELAVPKLNLNPINIIKECILYAEPNVAKRLADIMTHLQITDARLRSLQDDMNIIAKGKVHQSYLDSEVKYLCENHARVSNLFKFARGEETEINDICADDVSSASCSLDDSLRAHIDQVLGN